MAVKNCNRHKIFQLEVRTIVETNGEVYSLNLQDLQQIVIILFLYLSIVICTYDISNNNNLNNNFEYTEQTISSMLEEVVTKQPTQTVIY